MPSTYSQKQGKKKIDHVLQGPKNKEQSLKCLWPLARYDQYKGIGHTDPIASHLLRLSAFVFLSGSDPLLNVDI